MRIRLDQVRFEPFHWQETCTIPSEALGHPELVRLGPVTWRGQVNFADPGFYLKARLTYEQTLVCDRCLKTVTEPVTGDIQLLVVVDAAHDLARQDARLQAVGFLEPQIAQDGAAGAAHLGLRLGVDLQQPEDALDDLHRRPHAVGLQRDVGDAVDLDPGRDLDEHLQEARLVEGQVQTDRRAHADVPAIVRAGIAQEECARTRADVPVQLGRAIDQLRLPEVVDVHAAAAVTVAAIADRAPVPIAEAAAAVAVAVEADANVDRVRLADPDLPG